MFLPPFRPQSETKRIVTFLKKTFKAANHQKAIIAVSGGIDSATSLTLAAQALDPANVYVLKLPYNNTHPQLLEHTNLAIKFFKIPKKNVLELNIAPTVDKIWTSILVSLSKSQTGNAKDLNQIRLGNVMARVRMIYLYDTAKANRALVVGTENRSEELLGYFTRFGDAASDIEPIKHLYKTQVKQLAAYLKVPQIIIDQAPTAGLWLDQTDEAELGFSYEMADQILYLAFEQKKSPKFIAQKLDQEYKTELQRNPSVASAKGGEKAWSKTVSAVLDRVDSSHFKHNLPYTL